MVKRIIRNLYFLAFLNGFLIATLFYFRMEANYEEELFSAIRLNIANKVNLRDNQDSIVVKVMQGCNSLLGNRANFFRGQNLDGFKVDYLHPTSIDLMTANGACGSYAMVLARIFQNYDFSVRIAQMKANGIFAAHNVVEVKTNSGWAVLDPLFDVYFKKPGRGLASFADVKNNWNYYRKQLPVGYDSTYKYEDVRYSNWGKIPFLMPTLKKLLDFIIGKQKADSISLRTYFLRMYDFYFYMILVLYIPIFIFTVRRLIKTRLFPQQNIPLTVANIVRFLKIRLEGKRSTLNSQSSTFNAS